MSKELDYKKQALVYFLKCTGIMSSSELQKIQHNPLLQYVQSQKILNEQQLEFFYYFYCEYIIAAYAYQKNIISQQQFHDVLLRKIQSRTPSLISIEIPTIKANFKIILSKLEQDNAITPEESMQLQKQQNLTTKKSKKFNHYMIEKELGRGGMGVVYKAFDTNLHRHVALKIIMSENTQQEAIIRFMQESKAVAQLNHPNIVKIFEMGKNPKNYYAMEYIEGITMHKAIHDKQITVLETVQIISDIARALESAHQRKIIHRDIKPANIMLSNRTPKLMDFGLVKMESGENLSKTGEIIGTIFYMSPEQVETITQTDNRSDIYSLGATLYEALVGRPPFQGQTYINIIHQIVYNEPIALRKLNPDIAVELEAICLKCLEKKPELRYQHAIDLAEDLTNFTQGLPVSARPASLIKKTYRWCKRHYTFTFISMAFLFFIASLFYLNKRNNDQLNIKNQKLLEIKQKLERSNRSLIESKKQQEIAFIESQKRLLHAHFQMVDVYLQRYSYIEAQHEINKVQKILQLPIMSKIANYQNQCAKMEIYTKYGIAPHLPTLINEWKFTDGKKFILSSRGRYIAFVIGNEIRCHDVKQQSHFSIPCATDTFLCINENEEHLIYLYDQKIYTYDLKSKKTAKIVTSIAGQENFSLVVADKNWFAVSYKKNKKRHLEILNTENKKFQGVLSSSAKIIFTIAQNYLVANDRFQLKMIDLASGKQQTFYHLGNQPSRMRLANKQDLFIGDNAGNIYIYDTNKFSSKNNIPVVVKAHKDKIRSIQFSKDLQFFATMDNKTVCVWDYTTKNKVLTLSTATTPLEICFSKKNTLCVFFYNNNQELVGQEWSILPLYKKSLLLDKQSSEKFKLIRKNVRQIDSFTSTPVTFSSNNKFVAISYASTLIIWNLKTNDSYTCNFSVISFGVIQQILFTEDETKIICLSEYGKLVVLDTKNLQHTEKYNAAFDKDSVICLLDSRRLLIGAQKYIKVYDIVTGELRKIAKVNSDIYRLKVSPDKKYLAILQKNCFEIWQLQYNVQKILIVKKTTVVKGEYWFKSQIAWHPTSPQIVSATNLGIHFYHLDNRDFWKVTKNIQHERQVKRLNYSHDGKYLAVYGLHTTTVYDIENNLEVSMYPGHTKGISANFDHQWQHFGFPTKIGNIFLFGTQNSPK